EWVELATSRRIDVPQAGDGSHDSARGYGYQFWMSSHGYYGDGAYAQQCVVVPSLDLVVALTSANTQTAEIPDAIWNCLQPGIGHPESAVDDELLADRLRRLSLPSVAGSAAPERSVKARIDASYDDSALPEGTMVTVKPADGGWLVGFEALFDVEVG